MLARRASLDTANAYSVLYMAGFEQAGYTSVTITSPSADYCWTDAYSKDGSNIFTVYGSYSYSDYIANLNTIGGYIYRIDGAYQCEYAITMT